jgi:hypothetical protein
MNLATKREELNRSPVRRVYDLGHRIMYFRSHSGKMHFFVFDEGSDDFVQITDLYIEDSDAALDAWKDEWLLGKR